MFDMPREAPRTILSAATPYQRGVSPADYEVVVVDNGSTRPLPAEVLADLPPGVRVVHPPEPRPSPVFALNWAVATQTRGDIVLVAIDGARIFSAGLYQATLAAHDRVPDALVHTLGWHLGPAQQMVSVQEGYDQGTEDALLAGSGWPEDPDALFGISVFAGSSDEGFFRPIAESNAFSVPRHLLERIGGYDERYTSPGGGLANLELFRRYATDPRVAPVCLLSEGTFHQVHGGIATSAPEARAAMEAEHRAVTGETEFVLPDYEPLWFGRPRPAVVPFLAASVGRGEE